MKKEGTRSPGSKTYQTWIQLAGSQLKSAGLQKEKQFSRRSLPRPGRLEQIRDGLCIIQMIILGKNLKM
eukprot:475241-Amphidinium_carterae.1